MSNIGRGLGAIKEAVNKSNTQLKLKNGESAIVRILTPVDEIISVYEHTEQFNGSWQTVTCLGKHECPLCQVGKRPSFKSYLVVFDQGDKKVKIFKASKSVGKQLIGLIEEYGDLSKRDFKIYRQGDKLDTTYQFLPRDPSPFKLPEDIELPNIEDLVAPLSREAILSMMNGLDTPVDTANYETTNDEYPF